MKFQKETTYHLIGLTQDEYSIIKCGLIERCNKLKQRINQDNLREGLEEGLYKEQQELEIVGNLLNKMSV